MTLITSLLLITLVEAAMANGTTSTAPTTVPKSDILMVSNSGFQICDI